MYGVFLKNQKKKKIKHLIMLITKVILLLFGKQIRTANDLVFIYTAV